jgi:hypothetical protein
MPIVDRREFGGRFSVSENSKRLSNYPGADDVKFTFMKDGGRDDARESVVIGE